MILTSVLGLALLGQVVLPGSKKGLEEAQTKARIIVVARPAMIGLILGVGATSFGNVDLRHSSRLKGEVKEEELERVSVSASGHETFPKQDEEYIVFINDYANHLNVLKMLPKTEENLATVRGRIRAAENP